MFKKKSSILNKNAMPNVACELSNRKATLYGRNLKQEMTMWGNVDGNDMNFFQVAHITTVGYVLSCMESLSLYLQETCLATGILALQNLAWCNN